MKRITTCLLFFLLFLSQVTLAQRLKIHTSDGNVYQYSLSEIDSITFATSDYATSGCECEPLPSPTGATVTVSDINELTAAVQKANISGNLTILLEDGTYNLEGGSVLWIEGDNVTFRSVSGNRESVIIRGEGMTGSVSHIFNVPGKNFTAADMTIGWVTNHAIQLHPDADNALIHNLRIVDAYEQMLKISFIEGPTTDNGIVECCLFEYTAGIGPQYYIGGVDGHRCTNWIIRNNTFIDIRSPDPGEDGLAEHAIHFWSNSENTLVQNNLIINCDRGIGFGMGDRGHTGGMIKNNMVHTTRDVGIGLENASDVKVYNNTVYTENYTNSIEYRFPGTNAVSIVNNLTNQAITQRDGSSATLQNNITGVTTSIFIDATSGDLHLTTADPTIVDQGQTLSDVIYDFDCQERPKGSAYDIGADEF